MTFNFLGNRYIDVEPQDEVVFQDLPRRSSISTIRITNICSNYVLFKIKTTAPNTYVVRPNLVTLSPGEISEVQLYMKSSEGLPSVTNSKDRFMIIATDINGDPQTVNTNTIWGEKPADSLQQIKLKAAFKVPTRINKSPGSQPESIVIQDPRASVSVSVPRIKLDDSEPEILNLNGSINSLNTVESKKKPSISIRKSNSPEPLEYISRGNSHAGNSYRGNSQMGNSQMGLGLSHRGSSNIGHLQNSGSYYKSSSYLQTNQYNNTDVISPKNLFASPATAVKSTNLDEGKDFKKEYERLLSKVEEQEKQLLKVSEERNYVYNELLKLKDNLARKRAPTKNPTAGGDHAEFQIFHVIIVAIISLLLGAFFSV